MRHAGWARAGRCFGLAACALLFGSHGLQNAAANGDTRTISFRHLHTGESITVTYKRDGRYDEDAMRKINHEMRDWRRNEQVRMDPRIIDIIWEVNREVGGKQPIEIICGYRAPATNSMLRRRSRGVAQASQHTLGKAVDFAIPGVPLEQVRNAGLRLQRGGVGFYPTSGSPFVHLDVGSVRHWPRMTYDQLARVFPNGRTVHVPSNGRPLPGYSLALADVQKRGASPSQTSVDAARSAGIAVADAAPEKPKRSLLAALFGRDEEEVADAENAPAVTPTPGARTTGSRSATSPATAPAPRIRTAAALPVPLPAARPHTADADAEPDSSFMLASAESRPVELTPAAAAPPTDVFTARGLWEGPQGRPEPPASIPQAQSVSDAVPSLGPARDRTERPADRDVTGAVATWPGRPAPAIDRAAEAFAYASLNDGPTAAPAAHTASPMGAAATRAASGDDGITTILKRSSARMKVSPAAAVPASAPATPAAATSPASPARTRPAIVAGATYEDPWLRAVVLAPDLHNNLTVTAFEPPDPTQLQLLMHKPNSVVMMTFSKDPHLGMTAERFSGSAVVFVSTVTFANRTAMLR